MMMMMVGTRASREGNTLVFRGRDCLGCKVVYEDFIRCSGCA